MPDPQLIVIRGNSGSGKSSIAKELRLRLPGKTALIGQDHFRRIVLKEKEKTNSDTSDLIAQTVDFALGRGYHVVLEGIFHLAIYQPMFERLVAAHTATRFYYLDVSFEETLRRHATKPNAHEYGEKEMREWFHEHDRTGFPGERVLPEDYYLEQSVQTILRDVMKSI